MPEPPPPGLSAAIGALHGDYPPQTFATGEVLIDSVFLQTADLGRTGPPTTPDPAFPPLVGYIHEGLVRGKWHRRPIAPRVKATAVVTGDGRWIGADTFKYGSNLFQYIALAPTTASIVPLSWVLREAPREVLADFTRSVGLDWYTAAAVASLGSDTLERRTLLLLYDLSRLHPRPELEVRHRDLADMLGVARQTLNPILRGLDAEGLIMLGYAEIVVPDSKALVVRLRRNAGARRAAREQGPPGPGAR
jgi:hypothetical protein